MLQIIADKILHRAMQCIGALLQLIPITVMRCMCSA
jgi:hypothetical protein